MRRTREHYRLAVAVVTLLAGGCGGDSDAGTTGPGGSTTGSVQVTVTGAFTTSFTGIAGFSSDGALFQLSLSDGRTNVLGVVRHKGGRPAPGTHTISGDPQEVLNGTGFGGLVSLGGSNFGAANSPGVLTLTSSSSERVQGTLRLDATEAGTNRRVTITAQFDAVCAASTTGGGCV